jgi:hypothetical protein
MDKNSGNFRENFHESFRENTKSVILPHILLFWAHFVQNFYKIVFKNAYFSKKNIIQYYAPFLNSPHN